VSEAANHASEPAVETAAGRARSAGAAPTEVIALSRRHAARAVIVSCARFSDCKIDSIEIEMKLF